MLEALTEGFSWNLPEFGRRIRFYVLHGAKRVTLRPILRVRNSRKSLGARSREYGGWVMTRMFFSAMNCCTTSTVVGWWQECFSRRGIAAQQAMCGSVLHRDAETTRNKLRTNKSHLQIVGQNRMNGSVRDASVLFQLHDGHSSIILNQLSHFSNQRNSGNVLTALRTLSMVFMSCKL